MSCVLVGHTAAARPDPMTVTGSGATTEPPRAAEPIFTDAFNGENRLITNEYAFNNPDAVDAVRSDAWIVTSGSLFIHDGAAWSGPIDHVSPDAMSMATTNSAVLRAFTYVEAPADSSVTLRLMPIRFVSATAETAWDGAHLLVRVQNDYDFYAVSMFRRDGTVVIKRKLPGGPSNGGTYQTLAAAHAPLAAGEWHDVRVVARNDGDAVVIELWLDDVNVLTAVDTGEFGDPLRTPGTVGFRADNLEVSFDDLAVIGE